MLQKNPEWMKKILDFSDRYYARTHRTPSTRQIALGTGLKRSSVHNYLVYMDQQGMIEYHGQIILTPNIREMQQETRRVGIVGSISCGLPTDANVILDEYMSLPLAIAGDDDVYLLYANGDSMVEAGIEDGDMVLVRRQEEARSGDIVVAYVEGEGNTLKRLLMTDHGIFLHPENSAMKDIPVTECKIQGIAVWVMKNLLH